MNPGNAMLKITLAVAATLLAVAPAAADVVGWATVPSGDMLLINGQNYRVYGIDAVEPRLDHPARESGANGRSTDGDRKRNVFH